MATSPLGEILGHLSRELGPVLAGDAPQAAIARRARAVIPFRVGRGEDGKVGLFVGGASTEGASSGALGLEVDFEAAGATPRLRTAVGEARPEGSGLLSTEVSSLDEPVAGGAPATLRRRLEILLGGPPGFTTGARAAILADLLGEFGRPALLEALHGQWIREFDTGPEASASVSQRPF